MSFKRDQDLSDHDLESKKKKVFEETNHEQMDNILKQDDEEKKVLQIQFEAIYLNNLPSSESYERSYMHREHVTHVICAEKTDFLITGEFILLDLIKLLNIVFFFCKGVWMEQLNFGKKLMET